MEEMTLQINPELARQCLQTAHLYMETNSYRKALVLFDDVIFTHQPHNVEAHLEAARIYSKFDKPQSILKVVNHLHKFSVPSPESLLLLARAQFLLGQHQDCENSLKVIFAKVRDFPEAVALEGELCILTGHPQAAIERFKSLNSRFPKNYQYLSLLAEAYFSAKQYHRTISICTTLMKAGFKDKKITKLYEESKKYKRDEALRKLKEVSPTKWFFARIFDPFLESELRADSQELTTQENLIEETLIDDRTGLYNDRAAKNQIPSFAAKRKHQFFLVMADIDYFKSFNDVHDNHQVGNAVLKALARAGQKLFTKNSIWRYGGEEIVWVLDGSEVEVLGKAEQFRKYVEEHVVEEANEIIKQENIRHFTDGLDHKKDEVFVIHYPVTISQAIVLWGVDGNSLESLLTAADAGLYNAKESGRNALVYRSILKGKGNKPIKYTPEMLSILHGYAVKNGNPNWWAHLPKLSEKGREEALEYARNTMSDKEVGSKKH